MKSDNKTLHPESWDKYWHGTGATGAFSAGGVSHPVIEAFWSGFFSSATDRYSEPAIFDIATGSGAVVASALSAFGDAPTSISCVDISRAAIDNVKKRFPGIDGIVADARSIPLDDQTFDIVTSQFGVEYAGADAVFEAARLVNPGGRLALLMHVDGGKVHRECEDSLGAIRALQASDFIGLATELFRSGFAAVKGADRAPYDAAGSAFAPAVAAAEDTITRYGNDVAGGMVAKLYNDIARIHGRLPHYDADEVLSWLEGMEQEVTAYGERMASMIATARKQADFDVLCEQLRARGFKLEIANELRSSDEPLSLAWAVIALREGG